MKKRIYPAYAVIAILLLGSLVVFGCSSGKPKPKVVEYEVKIDTAIQNGTVEVSKTKAKEGDTITITPKPATGYSLNKFNVWKDTDTNTKVTVSGNTFIMPKFNVVVSAEFLDDNAPDFDIIIDPDLENGVITSSINKAKETQQITLTVTPSPNYKLDFKPVVTGEDSNDSVNVSGSDDTWLFTMPGENVFVTASFISELTEYYSITLVQGTGGIIDADGRDEAYEGATVVITATPDRGYIFDGITVEGDNGASPAVNGTGNELTFNMPAEAVTVTASFSIDADFEFDITIDPAIEDGEITADVDKAKAGDTVTLTATPESGYLLDSLTVTKAGGGVVATTATVLGSEYTFEMPVDDVTVTASFSNEPVFYITVDSAITNGTVIPDAPMATEGTTVTLTVEPDEKYMLSTLTITMGSGGTVTPAEVTAGSEYTFEMPGEDVEITASFILDPDYEYVITIDSAIEDGEVTADVDKAKAGDTVTLTATADSGYVLSAITVTKAGGGAVSTTPVTPGIEYTFEMPDDDVEVTAEFSSEPVYDITINSAMTNGAVTPDTPIATEGTTVTLTVTPDSGYLFSSITVTKDGGGTVATTTVTAGSVYTFIMPDDHVIVTAVFAALPYPLAIDDFAGRAASAPPTNYVYAGNSADPGWAIVTTDGRTHLWANVEPNTVTGSRFGRSAALDVNISDYISDPTAVILLDIRVGGSPYTYTFELTVNGTVYSTQIIGVQPGLDILHAIPLSQLVNAGTSMADLTGTVTVSSWAISCTAVAGLTGTRVYCISLDSVQSRTVTKGTVTGPAGNDFSIPASTQVPVGNAVPIGLTLAPSNRFLVLNFTPVVSVVQGKASLTIAYFIMPDANVTVGAEFELIPEPEMWVIEDISGAAARGITGWMGDWFNDTFGYWGVNIPLNWGGSAAQSGPNWFAANFGDAAEASNYVAVNPINRWIMQIETWTNLSVGRNLPSAMDISGKDTIRILLRRSGSITLQLGLFNGGQPLDGYQNPGGQAVAPTGGTIDIVKSGTGYWVAIPANTNSTNLASSTWDYLEIPLSSFTSQGFNPALLTGWGIRDMDTVPATPALHNRARFFLDNIVAFSQVDKKSISLTSSTGGTASGMSDTTAVGGQIIPLTVTPDTGYALEGFTANGIPCEIADTNRPNAFILPEELTGPVVINAIFRPLIYHLFEDFEGGGTFTNNTNSWNSNPNHNNVTGWFAISNSTQGTVTGSLSTAQTRPGTTGAQSGLLTWGQTNANSRDFRFGYRPYSPVINATNYTHITFWARSSRTGAHNAVLRNSDNNDISMAWTITTANTWEEKTIALPAGARDQINYLGFGLSGPATTQTGQTLYIDDVRWIE